MRSVANLVVEDDEAKWLERHLRALKGEALFGDRRAEAFAAWRRFVSAWHGLRGPALGGRRIRRASSNIIGWAADAPLLVLCTAAGRAPGDAPALEDGRRPAGWFR